MQRIKRLLVAGLVAGALSVGLVSFASAEEIIFVPGPEPATCPVHSSFDCYASFSTVPVYRH